SICSSARLRSALRWSVMISLFKNAWQPDIRLPLMIETFQMLIGSSGYPARLRIEATARVVTDFYLHNATGR
ncbi:hypothetical protein, partial [Pantoea eucalypti]|uniref:hypothetical protein n=1 Tax=Pantoea eucalypti TaxID=470933 RepID=UPI00289BFB7C